MVITQFFFCYKSFLYVILFVLFCMCLQAHDRLLLITEATPATSGNSSLITAALAGLDPAEAAAAAAGSSDLALHHVPLPAAYVNANWPLSYAAISRSGLDIAAACRRGLALYNRKSERWRLFGDISQERRVRAVALGWLDSSVVVCSLVQQEGASGSVLGSAAAAAGVPSGPGTGGCGGDGDTEFSCELPSADGGGKGPCQLLVFPKSHLDFSSLVASYQLPRRPVAMDCIGGYVLIAHEPLQLQLLQLVPPGSDGSSSLATAVAAGALSAVGSSGSSSSSSSGGAKLQMLREIVLCNVGRPLLGVALVLDGAAGRGRGGLAAARSSSSASLQGPGAAVGAPPPQQQQHLAVAGSSSSSSSPVGTGRGGATAEGLTTKGTLGPDIPWRCVVLRCGGLMSVLDLMQGTEITLSADIECFWLSDTLSVRSGGSSHNASAAASGGPSRSSSTHAMDAVATGSAAAAAGGVGVASSAAGIGAKRTAAAGGGGGGGGGANGYQLVAALAGVRLGRDDIGALGAAAGPFVGEWNAQTAILCSFHNKQTNIGCG